MTCHRSQELIPAFLDRELDPAANDRLMEHLVQCEECSQELRAVQQMNRALLNLTLARCPETVYDSLTSRIAQAPVPRLHPRRPVRQLTPAWSFAAAAVLLASALNPQSTRFSDVNHPVRVMLHPPTPLTAGTSLTRSAPTTAGQGQSSLQNLPAGVRMAARAVGPLVAALTNPLPPVGLVSSSSTAAPHTSAANNTAAGGTRHASPEAPQASAASNSSGTSLAGQAASSGDRSMSSIPERRTSTHFTLAGAARGLLAANWRPAMTTPLFGTTGRGQRRTWLAPPAPSAPEDAASDAPAASDPDEAAVQGTVAMAARLPSDSADLEQTGSELLGVALQAGGGLMDTDSPSSPGA